MINQETTPEPDHGPIASGGKVSEVFALVIAWSREEPWRIGQTLLIAPGTPGPVAMFGRGEPATSDVENLSLLEHRFDSVMGTPPLATASISRRQLEIRDLGRETLLVRNVGRCALLRNGVPTSQSEFESGDTLQLGRQLLFLVTKRRPQMPSAFGYPDFAFGEADSQGIVGESPAAWRLRSEIAMIAPRIGHVLVSGPSGAGKELAAQAVHALSPRGTRPLVARSAATIPETLIDAELFGNCRNYPNVGMLERPGLLGEAAGSSLFLDEIAELPHGSQAHLLRALDHGDYHRLGESKARRVDLRLIAATNRDITTLKHDFLARMMLRIVVPDLATRREDVPLLARHIIRCAAARGDALASSFFDDNDTAGCPRLDVDLVRNLLERRFDLGTRELATVLWQHLSTPEIRLDPQNAPCADLPADVPAKSSSASSAPASDEPIAQRIQRCLDENNGVVEQTWRALGMKNRFVLVRAIKKYGLEIRRRPSQPPTRIAR